MSRIHGGIAFQKWSYFTWKELRPQSCDAEGISRSFRGPREGLFALWCLNKGKKLEAPSYVWVYRWLEMQSNLS